MITSGGESAFVCRMVLESLRSRTRCRQVWYLRIVNTQLTLDKVVHLYAREAVIRNGGRQNAERAQGRKYFSLQDRPSKLIVTPCHLD